MGQREDVCGVGAGTVRMGRWVVVEVGGEDFGEGFWMGLGLEEGTDDGGGSGAVVVEGGEERETVLGTVWAGGLVVLELVFRDEGREGFDSVGGGRPDIMGGGSSSPSAALRESCRAKSEACHHSRNFRAKMEVGRRILRLERRRGMMSAVIVRGFKRLFA